MPEIANALSDSAVKDIPVAALIVALIAVSDTPVIARSFERTDDASTLFMSDVSTIRSPDDDDDDDVINGIKL
jgi:hypothetical protein